MNDKGLTIKKLNCLVVYKIDTCNKYSLLKILRLLSDLGYSFGDFV